MAIPLRPAGRLLEPCVRPERAFDLGNHRGLGHRLEIIDVGDLFCSGDHHVGDIGDVLAHQRIASAGRGGAQGAAQRALRIMLDSIE
jgi:hypothetical protein